MKERLTLNIKIDTKNYIDKLDRLKDKLMEVHRLQEELNNTTIEISIGGSTIAKEDIDIDKVATELSRKIKRNGLI